MTASSTERSTRFIEPMLCHPVHVLPVGEGWTYEVKWDGFRAIGSKHGKECHLFSRHRKSFDRDFPQLAQELAHLRCRSAVVDGELVAWDQHGLPAVHLLRQGVRPQAVTLMLFDLMMLNGRDLRDKPLAFRRKALASIMPKGDVCLLAFSEELHTPVPTLMDRAAAMHLEGIVAKRKDSLYEPGARSGAWVKCRAARHGNFLIGGYVPSPGMEGFDELILGELRHGKLHYVGRIRSGFTAEARRTIMQALAPLQQPGCPFADLPEHGRLHSAQQPMDAEAMARCRWVRPRGSVKVAFVEWSADRKLRNASFAGLAS